jgi:RNA polymerase sigma-70 factor (ECF subfamily)
MVEKRPEEEALEAALAARQSTTEEGWLEATYREHATAVLQTAYRVTGNAADAEDVLQTVFIRLARRKRSPDFAHGALPYLRRAATNAALDVIQSRRSRRSTALEHAPAAAATDPTPGPERLQLGREARDRLRHALAGLSRRHAEIFILRYIEDLDNGEIARLFDTSPGTIAVTLHRIRGRLMDQLSSYLGGLQ